MAVVIAEFPSSEVPRPEARPLAPFGMADTSSPRELTPSAILTMPAPGQPLARWLSSRE